MQTFNIYRGYDRNLSAKLETVYSLAEAKIKARQYASQYQTFPITVRDVLGGLRFEINLRAPEQHQEKETK
jgi:hypothetical protein